MLEKSESKVAEHLGISVENANSATVLIEAKRNTRNRDSCSLAELHKLHILRLQNSRALWKLPVELNVRPSQPGDPHHVDASGFWAILIGINEYRSYPLRGCVPDVQLMERYLAEDLSVPRECIQLLVGSKEHGSPDDPMNPSHAHIMGALLSLITNSKIAHNDNIIIYYSGHGTSYPYCEEDDEPDYIQTLCPIDRDTLDEKGEPVPDISDREFNTILSLISQVKGQRITVILDCCYSGGVCRGLLEPNERTSPQMANTTVEDMLIAGEKNLRHNPGYRSILSNDWLPDVDSHVVLAACADYQYAKAKKVRREDGTVEYIGIFTDLLVCVLRSGDWEKETTYAGLVCCLDRTSQQTPIVAGKHKDSHLWYQA